MSCLCLGPKRAGKSHLLKALQDPSSIDETTYSMPTMGTSIYTITFPTKKVDDKKPPPPPPPLPEENSTSSGTEAASSKGAVPKRRKKPLPTSINILEIGGSMAPIWHKYYDNVEKLIYVIDTSNLCQISAAGVLFYTLLVDPRLQKIKILFVLAKMDYAYRQMRNEALLMLQMSKLQKEVSQSITIVEASAVKKEGLDAIYDWLQQA